MNFKRMLAADAVVLVVYVLAANPSLTGLAVHEWVGLGVVLVLAAHVALHFDRAVGVARAALGTGSRPLGIVLDALLVMALATCAVSGVMVSGAVLPMLGLYAEGYYFWDPLHAASAKVLLALLLVHLALAASRMLKNRRRKDREE